MKSKLLAFALFPLTASCVTLGAPSGEFMGSTSPATNASPSTHKLGAPILTWGGDLAGSTNVTQTVAGIKGITVPTPTGTNTVLTYNLGAFSWGAGGGGGGTANVVTLEQFGAAGNGTTNDSAAMTSALAAISSGGVVQLGCNKTYLVGASSPYTLPANSAVIGCGDSSIIKTATNAAVFVPGGEQTHFEHLQFVGSGAGSSQIAIANQPVGGSTGYQRMVVRDVTCTNLGETCILTNNLPGPTGGVVPYYTTELDGIRVFGPATAYGLWMLGEYSSATNIKIDSVGEGIRAQGGNQSYSGGTITNCTTGFHLVGGGNDAHGTVTGMLINHNTTNLLVDNAAANTEHFVNDAFYGTGTAITLNGSHNVYFDSCQIDVSSITLTNAIGTTFSNCTWPGSFANAITQSGSTTFASGSNVDLNGNPSSIVAASGWVLDMPTTSHGAYTAGGGGSDFAATIGPDPGAETSAGTLHILPIGTARTSTNYVLQSDGSHTILDAPANSFVYLYEGGANQLAAFSLASNTIGYSDSRAVNLLLGSMAFTTNAVSTTYTIDSGTKQDCEISADTTSAAFTITLPAPTQGRKITLINGGYAGGSTGWALHNLTIARHGAEKINGVAASKTLTGAGQPVCDIYSPDATNWFTNCQFLIPFLLGRRKRRALNDNAERARKWLKEAA